MKKYMSMSEVRKLWGVGCERARLHLRQSGIPYKWHSNFLSIPRAKVLKLDPPSKKRKDRDCWEPTQEEIRQACLEIQSKWTEAERAKRYVGPTIAEELVAYGWDGYGFQEKLA